MDITYQSIALILRRLEAQFGPEVVKAVSLGGIPRDMKSAEALALKKDDRTRKEFEKWAVLTYSNNLAVINNKKGADAGIDGIAYARTGPDSNAKIVFQVKSGHVQRKDIATLNNDRQREGAEMAYFLTLEDPTKPMKDEAAQIGTFFNPLMGQAYPRVQIVPVKDFVEGDARLQLPLVHEVLKTAQTAAAAAVHAPLDFNDPEA